MPRSKLYHAFRPKMSKTAILERRLKKLEMGGAQELKRHDIGTTTVNPSSAGTTQIYLNGIAQGDTSITREGLIIRPKALAVKLLCSHNVSATTTHLRILIVRDKDFTGSTPSLGNILESVDTVSFKQHDKMSRYTIIRDINICLNNVSRNKIFKKVYIKLQGLMHYVGTGATAGDGASNALFMYMISDQSTNTPTVEYTTRLTFVE